MKIDTDQCSDDEIEITPEMIVGALLDCDPKAYISEQEAGWYVIDGKFNLAQIGRQLTPQKPRKFQDQPRGPLGGNKAAHPPE